MSSEIKEKEWLQFLEVIKRKYGYNLYYILKKYHYERRDNDSVGGCLLYTSPSPRDKRQSRMPSSA